MSDKFSFRKITSDVYLNQQNEKENNQHKNEHSSAPLPSNLSQKLIDEAVRAGIHQGDLMLEIMGNIIARRVSDGIESGTFQQNVKFKVKDVITQLFPRYFGDLPKLEQEKQIEQIETDDLTKFIDNMVSVRLLHDKQQIENRQNQEKLKQLEEKRKKRQRQEKLETINNWFFVFLISTGLFCLGVFVGINVLPSGVVCVNIYSPCYWLRFDNQKTTLD